MCFLFEKSTPAKNHTIIGISPLKTRVFALFDTLCEKFYECYFNNMFMSAKLACAYLTNHHKKVNVKGVCSVGRWGVPKEVHHHGVIDTKNKTFLGRYFLF